MSSALFRDAVTFYLPCGPEGTVHRRLIRNVKTVLTQSAEKGKTKATVYLPLWGRRSLRYLPDAWNGRADRYTVRPLDRLVCRPSEDDTPPEDALTVRTVICRQSGSRRLWHLEIHADNDYHEEVL
ncbi:MAG: hypothetical protein IJD10_01900, partial [Clostridia bacterium]|nr:hypothetical protein [Clostridia bacterium]